MKNVRVWFKKTGAAKYISHLDLTKCMSRALKLSRLPVWYTEGFNPRIYMTYAMPLSLGVSGLRECMDIRLTEDVPFDLVTCKLNESLPEDISVIKAAEPVLGFDAIEFADYEICLETQNNTKLAGQMEKLLSKDQIIVLKHGKKGDKEFDLKPHLSQIAMDCNEQGGLRLTILLSCSQSGSVNPSLLMEALKSYEGVEPYAQITRKRLLTKEFSEIR